MKRGQFITLEGGDGAGKSTQVKAIGAFLKRQNIDVIETREVGGSPSAEAIRELWLREKEDHWDGLSEVLLIAAARREHLVKTIFPALEKGVWVVSDRFVDSTRAYQGIGLGMGLELIDKITDIIGPNFSPDLTLLLDLPVDIGFSRMTKRGGQDDRYQQKDRNFHQKLRDAFLMLAQKYHERFRIIDASVDADAVSIAIEKILQETFKL